MKLLVFSFTLLILSTCSLCAQEDEHPFLKEYVKSFSLRNSDTILIELHIPYEIIDWEKEFVRTFTQVESFSMPDDILKRVSRSGRYRMHGHKKNNTLQVHMPDIHHIIMVDGVRLNEEVVAQIYVPKNFPLQVICSSKTEEEQVEDLWIQQELLTRRMRLPIRRIINSDHYPDVKFHDAEIVASNEIKGTNRFLELTVRSNEINYKVVSRIGRLYASKDLIGKRCVFVKHTIVDELRKLPNQGMVLVKENKQGELVLLERNDIPDFLIVN